MTHELLHRLRIDRKNDPIRSNILKAGDPLRASHLHTERRGAAHQSIHQGLPTIVQIKHAVLQRRRYLLHGCLRVEMTEIRAVGRNPNCHRGVVPYTVRSNLAREPFGHALGWPGPRGIK